jgi:hypothetical protein
LQDKKVKAQAGPRAAKEFILCVSASLRENKKIPFKIFYEGDFLVGPLGIEPSTYCPERSGESVALFLVFVENDLQMKKALRKKRVSA